MIVHMGMRRSRQLFCPYSRDREIPYKSTASMSSILITHRHSADFSAQANFLHHIIASAQSCQSQLRLSNRVLKYPLVILEQPVDGRSVKEGRFVDAQPL